MSLEKKLDQAISEAPQQGLQSQPAWQSVKEPSSPQQRSPDFAAVRKAMRKPMVNLDAQIHQIDQFLNTTQKDPSQLGSTVKQIEKSYNNIVDPLKQVRSGVQQLRKAANEFGAEYVGEKPKGLPKMTPDMSEPQRRESDVPQKQGRTSPPTVPGVRRTAASTDEERLLNSFVTNIESMPTQDDKLAAAGKGWQTYQKSGGQMNRGEFYRALVQKLRAAQPQESSVQRRKLI